MRTVTLLTHCRALTERPKKKKIEENHQTYWGRDNNGTLEAILRQMPHVCLYLQGHNGLILIFDTACLPSQHIEMPGSQHLAMFHIGPSRAAAGRLQSLP